MINMVQNQKVSSRMYVYSNLKGKIMNGEIAPGTKLSEQEISEKLGISRTPVREAFLQLAQEYLVGIYPQRGTIVTKIDLQLVEEGRFVREHIEKAIVVEACKKVNSAHLIELETNITLQEFSLKKGTFQQLFELDDEFHQLFYKICGKQRTWEMIKRMNVQFDRLRLLRLASNHDWKNIILQHIALFEALKSGNPDEAEKVIVEHLRLVEIEKSTLREQKPEFFV